MKAVQPRLCRYISTLAIGILVLSVFADYFAADIMCSPWHYLAARLCECTTSAHSVELDFHWVRTSLTVNQFVELHHADVQRICRITYIYLC